MIQVGHEKSIARYASIFDAPGLLRALKGIQPDFIYQRVGGGYTGIAAWYAGRYKAKLVWHISSDWDVQPMSEPISRTTPFLYLEKKALEYGIKRADVIIAQTQRQSNLLQANYGRKASTVIRNGHPFPIDPLIKTDPVKVIWIANWKPLKRPELFVQLARELSAETDAQFIMIGKHNANDQMYNILKDAKRLKNLQCMGKQPQEVINELLAGSHLLVNTSAYEGLPNTFIQAWMRKVPVLSISIDPDGLLSREGLGIVGGSYKGLRKSLLDMIQNSSARITMGERAWRYSRKAFSIENIRRSVELIME